MSWIQIRPRSKRLGEAVTLSITRRQRNGRIEHWARLGLATGIVRQLGLAPGDHVALFLGRDENRGKIALRKTEPRPDGFRLGRYGTGACLVFGAGLLDLATPVTPGRRVLTHRVAGDRLELSLPPQPPCASDPAAPRAEAERARPTAEDAPESEPRERYGKPWTAQDDARLREMRQAGLPAAAIAQALGRTPASVALRISKLRIPKRPGGRAGRSGPAPAARPARPAIEGDDPAVAEALRWLRWDGEPIERLDGGFFCIAGERVTPLRLVQIANNRRARRSLPPLPLPDLGHPAAGANGNGAGPSLRRAVGLPAAPQATRPSLL